MDLRQEFIFLCDEIISRLEEPPVEEWADTWWDDVEVLTSRLFEAQQKLQIGRPVPEKDVPALLIHTITKKGGVRSDYRPYFNPISSPDINKMVMMRTRDPATNRWHISVVYTDCRKFTQSFPTPESRIASKKLALKTVRQWLRVAQRDESRPDSKVVMGLKAKTGRPVKKKLTKQQLQAIHRRRQNKEPLTAILESYPDFKDRYDTFRRQYLKWVGENR